MSGIGISKIHLAPAHPCMGWVSMNRYWQALMHEAEGQEDVLSLTQVPSVQAPAWPRWQRQWIKQVWYPWMIRSRVRHGVLHVLDHSFAHLLAQSRPTVRTVVTVHDLIPLSDPADLTPFQRRRYQRTVAHVSRADRVVCVSEHTRAEVRRWLQVPEEKLKVLPNGTSQLPTPDEAMSQRMRSLPPYLFSVGGTRPRKNLRMLPELAKRLSDEGVHVVIVRAGGQLDGELAAAIRQHADLHELVAIQDAELAACYTHASLTLVPSLQEGFGLPVLEAMQAGCPVVYCQATSLPEVAGNAGLGFAPGDVAQAAAQCLTLLRDAGQREVLIESGRHRAALFTWQAHWQGLRAIYEELLNP